MQVIKVEDLIEFLELCSVLKKAVKLEPDCGCCCCVECNHIVEDCVCQHNESIDFINDKSFYVTG